MSEPQKVWVLYLDYRISEIVKVFTSEARARRWLEIWVEFNWNDFGPGGDYDPDIDPIPLFFTENETGCWYRLGECAVEE